MAKIFSTILQHIVNPPSYLILTIFTCVFFVLIGREVLGFGIYPVAYTPVYITVIIGTSLSNLLRKSRWFR